MVATGGWGVWSEGDHAALAVSIQSSGSDLVLELSGSGFVNAKCPQQLINVRVNEMPVGEILFSLDQPENLRRLRIPAEVDQSDPGGLLIGFRSEVIFELNGTNKNGEMEIVVRLLPHLRPAHSVFRHWLVF